MNEATIERAGAGDIPFLAEAILAAERGTGQHIGLARVFGLEEDVLADRVQAMLNEEVDGCEFSVSSFQVAKSEGRPVAAVAGWVEGLIEGMPSQMLRSNLIGFTFPPQSQVALRENAPALAPMRIDRAPGTLQIEYVYVAPTHRGRGLAAQLIRRHIAEVRSLEEAPRTAQVQVFADNAPAIRLYSGLGFKVSRTFRSEHPRITSLLPHHEKLLMELSPLT